MKSGLWDCFNRTSIFFKCGIYSGKSVQTAVTNMKIEVEKKNFNLS